MENIVNDSMQYEPLDSGDGDCLVFCAQICNGMATKQFIFTLMSPSLYLLNWFHLVCFLLLNLENLPVFHVYKPTKTTDTSFHLTTSFCQPAQREKYKILTV